jgi:hypothetical protein
MFRFHASLDKFAVVRLKNREQRPNGRKKKMEGECSSVKSTIIPLQL